MCAAKQFSGNQCAIKQYVYQYQEWQCVWNQQVAMQDAAELSAAQVDAWGPYVAQQCSQSQSAAGKYSQVHLKKSSSEQYDALHCTAQQPVAHHHNEEHRHLNHSEVQQFSISHDVDVVEQYDEDVCDLNQYTIEQYNEEEYDFNQYAVQQYLMEQFPTNCYAGDESDEENVMNQFMTEQYAFSPYCVEEGHDKDYQLDQLLAHNHAAEPCGPSQYAERHPTAYHQSAEEQCTLNQSAWDHYAINQYTEQWCTLNQYEEEQHFMYNYAAEQDEKEERYRNAACRFAEAPLEAQHFAGGHYAMNPYTSEQYLLDQSDLLPAAVGQHPANLPAFPHTQQFVAVRYAPSQYAVDQYFSDLYAAAEQYAPQQYHIDQYPESLFAVDHYTVKQHTGAQYKGVVCPFNHCESGKYVFSQYETQHYVAEHDAAKLQAAVQYEAQQQDLKYYGLEQQALEQHAVNQFEAEQCGPDHYWPEQYVMDHQQNALNQYATEQYALNQYKAEQYDLNHYLAEQYGINHPQNPAAAYRMGRKALGLYKTKQPVTNNSRTKRCHLNQNICPTVHYPTQQDAAAQNEEKPKATEHDRDQDSTELSAAKHDWKGCKGMDTADLKAAMPEVAQQDSGRSKVAEQDLDDGENNVPKLDAPESSASSPNIAKPDVQSKLGTEHKALNASGLSQCQKDCSPSSHAGKQWVPQPNASNHQDAAAQSQAVQLTIKDTARPCATSKQEAESRARLQSKCQEAGVQEQPVDSSEKEEEGLEVTDCKLSGQSTKPSNPDVAEWHDDGLDAAQLVSPEQERGVSTTADEDTAVQDTQSLDATQLNTTEVRTAGQDALHQTAIQLNVSEWDTARQASSGYDLVEPDAAELHATLLNPKELCGVQQETLTPVAAERDTMKQPSTGSCAPETVTDAVQNNPEQDCAVKGPEVQTAADTVEAKQRVREQHGTILAATGHNSTQLDASDWGATKPGGAVKEHTRADDGGWDATGQIGPERDSTRQTATECEATAQATAEQEPTDHNPGGGDVEALVMIPSEEDSAERYHRRGTRSCRTGCSRASFSKGQSAKARYYSRSHYSSR